MLKSVSQHDTCYSYSALTRKLSELFFSISYRQLVMRVRSFL